MFKMHVYKQQMMEDQSIILLYFRRLSTMQETQFPEDIQCIVDPYQGKGGIYVSNIEVAQNPKTLQRYGIGSVITAIKGKNLSDIVPRHIEYLYIPVVDSQAQNIARFFDQTNSFLEEQLQRTNVLVHCMAGISRSIALIMAYLMKKDHQSYATVYSRVKARRNIIHPNTAFIEQLKHYQQKLQQAQRQPSNTLTQASRNQSVRTNGNYSFTAYNQKGVKSPVDSQLGYSKITAAVQNYDKNLRQNIKSLFRTKNSMDNQQQLSYSSVLKNYSTHCR